MMITNDSMESLREYLPVEDVNVVCYHSNCCDGFGAAYCFWKYFSDKESDNSNISFLPLSHSTREADFRKNVLPKLKNKNVIFVDFIPPKNVLLDCLQVPSKVVMLDHHGPVVESLKQFDESFPGLVQKHIFFDNDRSGAILAWDYVFPGMNAPMFLQYIEDRDIWRQPRKFQETDPFVASFYSAVSFDFEEFDSYLDQEMLDNAIFEGKILLKYQALEILSLSKRACEREIVINDITYHVYVINTNVYFSDLGNYLTNQLCPSFGDVKCDFAMMWSYNHQTNQVKFSLRSDWTKENPTTNVAEIAQYFGGNGHAPAADFTVDYPDVVDGIIAKHTQPQTSGNSSGDRSLLYLNLLVACGLLGVGAAGGHFGPKLGNFVKK